MAVTERKNHAARPADLDEARPVEAHAVDAARLVTPQLAATWPDPPATHPSALVPKLPGSP